MRLLKISLVFAVALVFWSASAMGQETPDRNQAIEQAVEFIAANLGEGEEVDYSLMLDQLLFYYDSPLNINTATSEELSRLFLLNVVQVNGLLKHIEKHGKLRSIYELQAVEGWTLSTIYAVLPFVRVGAKDTQSKLTLTNVLAKGEHDLIMRWQRVLEELKGFSALGEDPDANRYLGGRDKKYLRYRFTSMNRISLGFTAEQDAGEEWGKAQDGYFDFLSGHIAYSSKGFLKTAIAGDYQLQFGQGLAAWSGLGFGKSAFVMNVKRSARGLRPYTSVDENRFLRGGAISLGNHNWDFTTFYSKKKIDANLVDLDSLDQFQAATSFFGTGFHRTLSELDNKDAVEEQHFGGRLGWQKRALGIGVSHIQTEYSNRLNPADRVYNRFAFSGNQNQVTAVDMFALINNAHLYGEVARSKNGGIGAIGGLLLPMHPKMSLSMVARHYDKDFQTTLGSAFGEASSPINESGLYMGIEIKPDQKWTLNMYYDQFKFDWLRFRQDGPARGNDKLAQLNFRQTRNNQYYVRVRHRNRLRNGPSDLLNIDAPLGFESTQLRFDAQYKVAPGVRFKSRVEWIEIYKASQGREHGWLVSHDIIIKPLESKYSLSFRYALFDTDGFDSRLYSYESDLLYTYSIPAYFHRGSRVYGMLKYRIARKTDIWIRYSRWFYEDRESISSGLNAIEGSIKSELKLQLRVRF